MQKHRKIELRQRWHGGFFSHTILQHFSSVEWLKNQSHSPHEPLTDIFWTFLNALLFTQTRHTDVRAADKGSTKWAPSKLTCHMHLSGSGWHDYPWQWRIWNNVPEGLQVRRTTNKHSLLFDLCDSIKNAPEVYGPAFQIILSIAEVTWGHK